MYKYILYLQSLNTPHVIERSICQRLYVVIIQWAVNNFQCFNSKYLFYSSVDLETKKAIRFSVSVLNWQFAIIVLIQTHYYGLTTNLSKKVK